MHKFSLFFYLSFAFFTFCQNETTIPPEKQNQQIITPFISTNFLLQKSDSIPRELLPSSPVCIENDICWGNQLRDAAGGVFNLASTSPSDIWALSSNGRGLFHFDGTKWSLVPNSFGIQGKVRTQTPNQI